MFNRRWLLPMLVLASLGSPPVLAVDKSQLWLPRNYYRYFRELYDAAKKVEETERCVYIIDGTVNQDRSSKKHPIFKITCRDPNRLTFSYMVDGLSLEILNLPPPPDPEELARRARRKELAGLWQRCMTQLQHRTAALNSLQWLTEEMPDLPLDQTEVIFHVDFDARSKSGRRLRYQGVCDFAGTAYSVNIYARLPPLVLPPVATEPE